GMAGFETGQRTRQLIGRGALGAAPDRGDAYLLDPLEKRLAALLGQHAADHGAEPADVLAQRAVVRQEFGLAVCFHADTPRQAKHPAYRIEAIETPRRQA